MRHLVFLSACLTLLPALTVLAEDAGLETKTTASEAKELSGMSIVGNDEAPKSLYIVPWKSSELGDETTMTMLVDGNAAPVDREVFQRQLAYYSLMTNKPGHTP